MWCSVESVTIDALPVTTILYLSGNARSDLYVSYFVLVLAGTSVRRLSHSVVNAHGAMSNGGGLLGRGRYA